MLELKDKNVEIFYKDKIMSILIDELIATEHDQEEVGNKWYIAKPLGKKSFIQRCRDAINVLWGDAQAFHYFEDEANTWGEVTDVKSKYPKSEEVQLQR